jgi:hypothetical protein
MNPIRIQLGEMPPECEMLRRELREFLADALKALPAGERAKRWQNNRCTFSKHLGEFGCCAGLSEPDPGSARIRMRAKRVTASRAFAAIPDRQPFGGTIAQPLGAG